MSGVLIRENTVRYFTLTSELIFPRFGNIKKKYIRPCPRNWSYRDVFDHLWIFQTYLTTSWTNLTLHFVTWCNYAAQLHHSLRICINLQIIKSLIKGKISPDQWMEKLFPWTEIFKVLNWLMSQYRKTIVAEFFFKAHSPVVETIPFWN